jgi:hypothetical protein
MIYFKDEKINEMNIWKIKGVEVVDANDVFPF